MSIDGGPEVPKVNVDAGIPLLNVDNDAWIWKDETSMVEGPDHSKLPYLTPEEYMKSVEAAFRGYYRSFNSDWQGHSSYYEKKHVADLGSALEFANRIACEAILGLPR